MRTPVVGSRLLTLRRSREAARRGHELLNRKREALVRELTNRIRVEFQRRREVLEASASARQALHEADVELGRRVVESSSLAQPETARVQWQERSFLGVSLPEPIEGAADFRPRYGAAVTSASLDRTGAAYLRLVRLLVRLSASELAVRNLREGLGRTARRVNALEKVILPDLNREIRALSQAVEEEERDEALRRKRRGY